MTRYAEGTTVPSDRSRAEIEKVVSRYGADSFGYGWQDRRAMIGFRMHGKQIRFILPMPDRNAPEFSRTPTGRPRTATAAAEAFEREVRQRWRALALVVKAKLVAVEEGVVTFEEEFGAYVVLPDGRTVGEYLTPAIEQAYQSGRVPPLLPAFERRALEAGSSLDG